MRQLCRTRRKWSDPEVAEMALKALVTAGYGELYFDEETGGRPASRFRLFETAPVQDR